MNKQPVGISFGSCKALRRVQHFAMTCAQPTQSIDLGRRPSSAVWSSISIGTESVHASDPVSSEVHAHFAEGSRLRRIPALRHAVQIVLLSALFDRLAPSLVGVPPCHKSIGEDIINTS